MALPSSDDIESLKSLLERDAIFREKMEAAMDMADQVGDKALRQILTAQDSLQRLSEGGYPTEMTDVIKDTARATFTRYADFLDNVSLLKEPRLAQSYESGHSPIYSLPPEILSAIFAMTSPIIDEQHDWTPTTLLLVCRDWKNIAEDTPSLWRHVDSARGINWAHRAVQWSKAVSLDVHLGDHPDRTSPFTIAEAVLPELPRIRRLVVSVYKVQDRVKIVELLSARPAPCLSELVLSAGAILHQDLFASEVPSRLRTLTLQWVAVNPACPILRAPLTSLTVQLGAIWNTADELLDTLAGLPTLEHLVLRANEQREYQSTAVSSHGLKSVKLLRLKSLNIWDTLDIILAVFPCLDILNVVTLTIVAYAHAIASFMQSDILARLTDTFSSYLDNTFGGDSAPANAFTSASITPFSGEYAHHNGYCATFSDPVVPREGLAQFTLGFTTCDYGTILPFTSEFRTLLARTLSWAPLHCRVRCLKFTKLVWSLQERAAWTQIFDSLSGLEEVHIGYDAQIFMDVLLTRPPGSLPLLRKLVFVGTNFTKVPILGPLLTFLSARGDLGLPLMVLSFLLQPPRILARFQEIEGAPGVDGVYVHARSERERTQSDSDSESEDSDWE